MITYGEPGEKFYVILSGQVSVTIPNPGIKGWKDHRARFTELQHWEETSYRPLVDIARNEFMKQEEVTRSFENEYARFEKI